MLAIKKHPSKIMPRCHKNKTMGFHPIPRKGFHPLTLNKTALNKGVWGRVPSGVWGGTPRF